MEALEQKILSEGKVLPGNVLKVGSFLNQQIDTPFMLELGKEIANRFKSEGVTKILTIEASGIALSFAAAVYMGVPIVFAKKSESSNVSGHVLTAPVHSYTHNNDYNAVIPADYINKNDRILLVDDFLATGEALHGLFSLAEAAGAEVVGCAIAIEKGFQSGGDELRKKGVRVESLAIIESMESDSLTFRR